MTNRTLHLAACALLAAAGAPAHAQNDPDDRVGAFLQAAQLGTLLETQLFERLSTENDPARRLELAEQLSGLYLDTLRSESLTQDERARARTKGAVLVRLMPNDALLDLRLELVVDAFREIETRPELVRIGLLDDETRELTAAQLKQIERDLFEIATTAQRIHSSMSRSRASSDPEIQTRITELLAVRSRAFYTLGWCGYARAVVERSRVPEHVFARFGWVLGFEGSPPVLDEVNAELFGLDHVARAALGVAQSRVQNEEYTRARVWLRVILDRRETPDAVRVIAQRRVAETHALELDWIEAHRTSESLIDAQEMNTASSRIILDAVLSAIAEDRTRRSNGGLESAQQLSRLLIRNLIDEDQFNHVLDLADRYDIAAYIGSGFLGAYSVALDLFERAEFDDSTERYADAAQKLAAAVDASDAPRYAGYRTDAIEKLAIASMRAGNPERARRTLEEAVIDPRIQDKDELRWLLILATDQTINDAAQGSPQGLEDRLRYLVGTYIDEHPGSDRSLRLVMNYADRVGLAPETVIPVLRKPREDTAASVRARRMLVRYLIDAQIPADPETIQEETQWVLEHEPETPKDARDARNRVRFYKDVVGFTLKQETPDPKRALRLLARAENLVAEFGSLEIYARELALRRVQLLLLDDRLDDASAHVTEHADTLDDLKLVAHRLVLSAAWNAFRSDPGTTTAVPILEHGQALIGMMETDQGGALSRDQSILCEQVAAAAAMTHRATGDTSLRSLAMGLSLRVFDHGDPSIPGLIRTAELAEQGGLHDRAIEAWNTLVNALQSTEPVWGRARYESFRLMRTFNHPSLNDAAVQYRALYPQGIDDPWGTRIDELLSTIELGAP